MDLDTQETTTQPVERSLCGPPLRFLLSPEEALAHGTVLRIQEPPLWKHGDPDCHIPEEPTGRFSEEYLTCPDCGAPDEGSHSPYCPSGLCIPALSPRNDRSVWDRLDSGAEEADEEEAQQHEEPGEPQDEQDEQEWEQLEQLFGSDDETTNETDFATDESDDEPPVSFNNPEPEAEPRCEQDQQDMVDEAALGVQGPDPQGDDSGDENSQPSQAAFTFTCKCGICGDASSANSSSASCMVASGGGGGGGDPGKNAFVVNSNGSPLALTLNFTQCDIGSIVLPRVPRGAASCPGCRVLAQGASSCPLR